MSDVLEHLHGNLRRIADRRLYGRVASVQGMLVEIEGLQGHLSIGDRCRIAARNKRTVVCECVGFRDHRALVMPYQALEGVALGARAEAIVAEPAVRPNDHWLGRVINAFAEPVDGGAPLPQGNEAIPIRSAPPSAHARKRISG